MTGWEHLIRNKLLTTVPALGARVYPLILPNPAEFPAATYAVVSLAARPALTGNVRLARAVVQLAVWSQSLLVAADVARSAIDALDAEVLPGDGWRLSVQLLAVRDFVDEELKLFAKMADFSVHIERQGG